MGKIDPDKWPSGTGSLRRATAGADTITADTVDRAIQEDIYNRLDSGAAGSQIPFTEPAAGPGTGTMHTLNNAMSIAPEADDTNGAAPADVLAGKTYWGLRTDSTWGAANRHDAQRRRAQEASDRQVR